MSAIKCYDSDGRLLTRLFQYDTNQTMTVIGVDSPRDPVFHFCNHLNESAVVVAPEVTETSLTVQIPNYLLQQSGQIIAYLYVETPGEGHRTIHAIYIPVVERPIPDDYEFIDNVDYVKAQELLEKMDLILSMLEDLNVEGSFEELIDIRNGYDGTVYDSAGDAVRSLGSDYIQTKEIIINLPGIATDAEVLEMIDEVFGVATNTTEQTNN